MSLSRKASVACNSAEREIEDASRSMSLVLMPGEARAAASVAIAGVAAGAASTVDFDAAASGGTHFRPRPDWEAFVNRLLDWADEARRRGRRQRAEDLVCLAWEAYERMHPRAKPSFRGCALAVSW